MLGSVATTTWSFLTETDGVLSRTTSACANTVALKCLPLQGWYLPWGICVHRAIDGDVDGGGDVAWYPYLYSNADMPFLLDQERWLWECRPSLDLGAKRSGRSQVWCQGFRGSCVCPPFPFFCCCLIESRPSSIVGSLGKMSNRGWVQCRARWFQPWSGTVSCMVVRFFSHSCGEERGWTSV